jgi:spore cortex formation protein SpoVR/YcgB (stage V sporulation)
MTKKYYVIANDSVSTYIIRENITKKEANEIRSRILAANPNKDEDDIQVVDVIGLTMAEHNENYNY